MFPSSMVGERAGICTLSGVTPSGEKKAKHLFRVCRNQSEKEYLNFRIY